MKCIYNFCISNLRCSTIAKLIIANIKVITTYSKDFIIAKIIALQIKLPYLACFEMLIIHYCLTMEIPFKNLINFKEFKVPIRSKNLAWASIDHLQHFNLN